MQEQPVPTPAPEPIPRPQPTPQPPSSAPQAIPVSQAPIQEVLPAPPPVETFEPVAEIADAVPEKKPEIIVWRPKRSYKKAIILLILILLLMGASGYEGWRYGKYGHFYIPKLRKTNKPAQSQSQASQAGEASLLTLDPSKNYGNKYANGLLPVGDKKYVTDAAKKGYVYACNQYAQNLASDSGGASTRGPWFANNNTQYDITKKSHVQGSVHWQGKFADNVSGNTRTITSNDLPVADPTGIFPIKSSDPAYKYDRNPNTITSQSFTYALAASPAYNATPECMGGQVGVMTTGVALFNAFDAGGRDAGAWEVQDNCDGHPEKSGTYHYHMLSSCIKDVSVQDVIGFALDGLPITGPKVGDNNFLTTDDLDECHGITSEITLDNKKVSMYHYVMTEDFPYSVSCFRAKAIQPPGLASGGGQTAATGQQPAGQFPVPPRR